MKPRRRPSRSPGGPPLAEKRRRYIELMTKGVSNSAACRIVGVNRRTGTRWKRGRTITNGAGHSVVYRPIVEEAPAVSARWLSEGERIVITDGLAAGSSIRAIANELGRASSTVSREIRRNRDPDSGSYLPFGAHRRSVARRARPKVHKFDVNAELRPFAPSDGPHPMNRPGFGGGSSGWRQAAEA